MENMNAEYWVNKGNESHVAKNYEEAIKCYETAIQLDPNNIMALNNCGLALHQLAELKQDVSLLERASEKYNRAIQLNPSNGSVFYNYGNVLFSLAEIKQDISLFENAIKLFDRSTQLSPTDDTAFNNYGNALYRLAAIKQDVSLFQSAIKKYDKAMALNPNDASAFYNCGFALSHLAEITQSEDLLKCAIEIYEESIKLDPTYASALCNCGIALYKLAKIKKDVSLFERAIEKYDMATQLEQSDINKAKTFNSWGVALDRLSTIKKDVSLLECALEKYYKATQLAPNYTQAFYNMDLALYRIAKAKQNIEPFDSVSKEMDDANILLSKGKSYLALNQIEYAKRCFMQSQKGILEILTFLDKENREKIIKTEILHSLLDLDNNDGVFFKETIKSLPAEEKRENIDKYKSIYTLSVFIINLLHVTDSSENRLAHYCKKDISQILLLDGASKFRLNAIDYSNDPSEGKSLLDFLYKPEMRPSDERLDTIYKTFAGCFTFDYNNLNLFRLYGKEADKEGTGLSLVFLDSFFSKKVKMVVEPHPIDSLKMKMAVEPSIIDSFKIADDNPIKKDMLALFRCIYIDPSLETKQPIVTVGQKEEYLFYRENIEDKFEDYNKEINAIIGNVREKMAELKELASELNPAVVGQLLLHLRYLVKHVAFKEEQECRIVKILHLHDKDIHVDPDFKQMYINYAPSVPMHLEKIYFGPKAPGIELFQSMLKNKKLNILCEKSTNPLA